MSEDPANTVGYRLTIEAVGLTKAIAAAQALRLMAHLVEDPTEKGHSTGSETGNASGKFDKITR